MDENAQDEANGEVCKLFQAPQGPDSGFTFYEGHNGKRRSYFVAGGLYSIPKSLR